MNKNTKRNSVEKHKAARTGSKSGVLSCSPHKNVQMVVYHNKPEHGPALSLTRFEPLNKDKQCFKRVFPKVSGGGR